MIDGLVKAKRAYYTKLNRLIDYKLIKELYESNEKWDISFMCENLEISRAAYYKWLNSKPTEKQLEDERILTQIKEISTLNNSLFGVMNMYYTLRNKYHFLVDITGFIVLCVSMISNLPLGVHQSIDIQKQHLKKQLKIY